jgi:RNA polymerase sigma factor (sigma-70 family)
MSAEIKKTLGRMFREERGRLLAFIRQRVDTLEDAEDILQDVFYHTLRGYSVTEPIENLAGWLYVSARNRIIDGYRKKGRSRVSLENAAADESLSDLIAESGLHPEKKFTRHLVSDAITDAVAQLPESQRQVVIWQMIEGRTFQEISDATGDPIGTLISRKRYALRALREKLIHLKDEIE